jgi:hypothetical protein
MSEVIIETRTLTRVRARRVPCDALKDVGLDQKGEFALMGPSGSGNRRCYT